MPMTVKELKEWLAEQPEDAIVCVYADHGQSTMKASTTTLARIRKEDLKEYLIDTVHDDDVEEGEEYIQVVEIGAP